MGDGAAGAILIRRTMFDVGEEPWGPDPPFAMPGLIVTHRAQSPVTKEGGTTFTFVTDGIHVALEEARAAAGAKDVLVIGGQYRPPLPRGRPAGGAPACGADPARRRRPASSKAGGAPGLELVQALRSSQITHLTYHVRS